MLDSQGLIPMMPPAQALKLIQVMADNLHNWYDGASTRKRSKYSLDDTGVVSNRLDSLEYDMLKFKENIHAIQYIGFLEETINKYCEESIKEQATNDEWIRKFRENTNLNLEKLDAANMEKAREVREDLVPRDLPIVKPYVPPVPFPGRLKEQEDDPYITREYVCTIGFSK
ncbi:hypothetical protein Tco_1407819 [Tanacetum coccineum]